MWLLIDVNESKRITESSRGAVLGRVHEVAQIISPIEKNTKIKTKKLPGAHIYGDASTIWGGVPKLHPTPTPQLQAQPERSRQPLLTAPEHFSSRCKPFEPYW